MSSTLHALLLIYDLSALAESNIHSIFVDVNHFGMDREHSETLHHFDTSLQHKDKGLQHNSRPIAFSAIQRHMVKILLQAMFAHTSGRTSDSPFNSASGL